MWAVRVKSLWAVLKKPFQNKKVFYLTKDWFSLVLSLRPGETVVILNRNQGLPQAELISISYLWSIPWLQMCFNFASSLGCQS